MHFEKSPFSQMFVSLRGILKVLWGRGLYWYILCIIISIIIMILLIGFTKTLLLHTQWYQVSYHCITLKRWKEWCCAFYLTLIISIRIWIIVVFTICLPLKLSKAKETLWSRESFKSFVVKSVAGWEGTFDFFIWCSFCLSDLWFVWNIWHLTWVEYENVGCTFSLSVFLR